jgi:conjugal transfer pilus assembly protein TraD
MSTRPGIRAMLLLSLALSAAAHPVWAVAGLAAVVSGLTLRRAARFRRAMRVATEPGEAIALGADRNGGAVVLTERQLSAHALIVGASGAGKSTTLLRMLTEQVRLGAPVIAIDMKGSPRFAQELASAAESSGRTFRLWTPDGPEGWNPLALGNATELKDKLIATERFTEPHYQRAAERYTQTVFQVLAHANGGSAPTLEQVVRLMEPHRIPTLLRAAPRDFAERVQDYLATLGPDQLSAIRGLGTRLAIITESHSGAYLRRVADRTPIDLRTALDGREVVAFSLNSSTYGRLSAQLGALAIQDLVSAAGHRMSAPGRMQALVGIDEFSALDGDNVISLLARSREAGVSVLLCTQELADLDRAAPGLRDQVLGSTALKIAHRQDVPGSAQTIAQIAGTETVWDQSNQVTSHPLLGTRRTGRATRRQVERFLVHPNEVKTLPTGQAVVISKLPRTSVQTVLVAPSRRPPPGPGTERTGGPAASRRPPSRGLER